MIIYEKLSDDKKIEFEIFPHYGYAVILITLRLAISLIVILGPWANMMQY